LYTADAKLIILPSFLPYIFVAVIFCSAAPTAAFIKNPTNVKQVGIGVGKGTVSLFSHSTSGFFGFTARLFSQAGQFTSFFSLDSEYRQWHRERIVNEATNLERVWKRRGIQNAEDMLLRPITDVFLGISLGVSGVVMSPYRGARKGGTKGFLIGTGVGVAGKEGVVFVYCLNFNFCLTHSHLFLVSVLYSLTHRSNNKTGCGRVRRLNTWSAECT